MFGYRSSALFWTFVLDINVTAAKLTMVLCVRVV
jgi:hypothetical protein